MLTRPRLTIGVSLKMYFGHEEARRWFADVADRVGRHPATRSGRAELFVLPTFLQIGAAIAAFEGLPVAVGAQDVAATDPGAYTGEVSARELREVGATLAAVGHAERRRLFGETDEVVAAKAAAAVAAGLVPVICVGDAERADDPSPESAVRQLRSALALASAGPVIAAYEPGWAIGAPAAAPVTHVAPVVEALRNALHADPQRAGSAVLYGGAAGPGLLPALGDRVDGLFLGRFAHDPAGLERVLDDVLTLDAERPRDR